MKGTLFIDELNYWIRILDNTDGELRYYNYEEGMTLEEFVKRNTDEDYTRWFVRGLVRYLKKVGA